MSIVDLVKGIPLRGLALTMLLAPCTVSAAVLDFSEVTSGWQGGTQVILSNATINTIGADIYVFSEGQATPPFGPTGGFCGVTAVSGYDCATVDVIDFAFSGAIANLSFQTAQFDSGDAASASIYAGATLLDTITINSAMLVDFTGYSGITSLIINDLASTGYGFAYGDFEYSEVPIPAAAWLFGSGLVGLAGIARKRKAS